MSEYLIYLRKSRQDDPLETVEQVLLKHEIVLQEYALQTFGYRIPDKDIYREVVSGETIDGRPMIKKLFSRIENETIQGVLVMDISRLTRGDLFDMGTVVHAFLYTDTKIITPAKAYDLSDKYDRKFFEMELSKGSDYLDYTKEILVRGRLASKRRGNWIHNTAPYGYDRVKVGKDWTLAINEKEAYYVRLAFELYNEGLGAYSIMNRIEALGARPRKAEHFSEAVIRQMLTNEAYIGKIRINERTQVRLLENGKIIKKRIRHKDYELVDGKHEAIISEDLFYAVQARRGSVSKEAGGKELKNIWAGLIKCGVCGTAMVRVDFVKNGVATRKPRLKCKYQRTCSNMSHNIDEVHEAIVAQLKQSLEDFSVKVEQNGHEAIAEREALIASLNSDLAAAKKKQEVICEYLETGVYTVDMFVARNNKLKEEIERLEAAIAAAEREVPAMRSMNDQLVTFHQTLDMLDDDSISPKVKNLFLKKIINVIYYKKDASGVSLDVHLHV